MSKNTLNNTLNNDGDHIYYNVSIKKNDQNQGIAIFDDNRTEAVLQNPSNYDIAVLRFSVPSQSIPIFLWKDKEFYITLEYNTQLFYKKLVWFPNSPSGTYDYYGNAVWNYNDFIQSINIGFLDCFNQLKVVYPLAPFTLPPKMVYNPISQLNSIYVEPSYESTLVNPIKIWFNNQLGSFFPAFQNFGTVDLITPFGLRNKQILILKNLTNIATIETINYIYTEEEFTTLFIWSDFKTIVFETDLPVITESQGAQVNKYRRVLTDFEPYDSLNDRSSIQYTPSGLPRFYDLISSYPLNRVSIRVLWETKTGEFYPVRLTDFDILTIKLYFKRRGTMINF